MKRIAIQGICGSYHDLVAKSYFGKDISVVMCDTFDEVASKVLISEADLGVMAIENSIVGSLLPNYSIIDKNELVIIGEKYLNINHCLMGLKNQKLEEIEEIYSHPMAFLQCKEFLEKHSGIKLIESSDTAIEAKRIDNDKLKKTAAIASIEAASIYNLEVFEKNIQTIKDNTTRFVIISKEKKTLSNKELNKASLKFQLNHKRGSLATVLNVISDCNINLTKIQSLPEIKEKWKYSFFVDITFEHYDAFVKVKELISIMSQNFKVIGEYNNTL